MSDQALLESGSTPGQLWQKYRIFPDRLELRTMFGKITIPFGQVESLEVAEPTLKALLHLRFDLKNFPFGVKLDFSDVLEHVVLDRDEGVIRRILFTPDDPANFKRVFDAAFARWRAGQTVSS